MKYNRGLVVGIGLAMLAWGMLPAASEAAPVTYHVTLDTSTISGTNGSLEFQFNPFGVGSEAATVAIAHLTGGTVTGTASPIGDVSGDLSPGPLTIGNTTGYNDVLQPFTFGSSLGFDATFAGTALDSPNSSSPGSAFSLTLWDDPNAFGNQLLVGDAVSGAALILDANADGSLGVFAANPAVTASATATPEPSSLTLFALGLAGLWGCRRSRSRRKITT